MMPWLLATALGLLAAGSAADAQAVGTRRFVSEHEIAAADGHHIRYRATAEDIVVPVPGGSTAMFAYSYEAAGADAGRRPVIFAYNGGQVSSSVYLYMGLLGPKLLAFQPGYEADRKPGRLIDNADTLLDTADIVLIDAPNTGLGRMIGDVPAAATGGTVADTAAFDAFIRAWLARHHRQASPRYLLGESYGSVRSAALVDRMRKDADPIMFDGVILLGQALDESVTTARTGNDLAYVLLLPSQAATAWYHRKAGAGVPLRDFIAQADRWARTDYIQALLALDGPPGPVDRRKTAETLARFDGLSPDFILAHDLRVDRATFAHALLADRGRWISQDDGRLQQIPGDDTRLSADRMETDIAVAMQRALVGYLKTDLGVAGADQYRVQFDHPAWRFVYPATRWWYDYTPLLADAMRADPAMRLFFASGDYDILTPAASARHAAAHADIPADRVVYGHYGAGHMPYLGLDNARRLSDDIRRFVQGDAPR